MCTVQHDTGSGIFTAVSPLLQSRSVPGSGVDSHITTGGACLLFLSELPPSPTSPALTPQHCGTDLCCNLVDTVSAHNCTLLYPAIFTFNLLCCVHWLMLCLFPSFSSHASLFFLLLFFTSCMLSLFHENIILIHVALDVVIFCLIYFFAAWRYTLDVCVCVGVCLLLSPSSLTRPDFLFQSISQSSCFLSPFPHHPHFPPPPFPSTPSLSLTMSSQTSPRMTILTMTQPLHHGTLPHMLLLCLINSRLILNTLYKPLKPLIQ